MHVFKAGVCRARRLLHPFIIDSLPGSTIFDRGVADIEPRQQSAIFLFCEPPSA